MGRLARRNKKRKRGKLSLRGLIVSLALLAISSLIGIHRQNLSQWARDTGKSLLHHPYFSVQQIKVKGAEKIQGSQLLKIAGLRRGMSIWKTDLRSIEESLKSLSWVKRAVIRREFPDRVVIDLEERKAKAIIVLGKLYYVDSGGYVFKGVEKGERVDFPLITGLGKADLVSNVTSTRRKIQRVLRLLDLTRSDSLALSEIHFRPDGTLVLYPVGFHVPLIMGWGDWQRKLQHLGRILAMWKGKEDRLFSLDLSFDDLIVARRRKGRLKHN